VRHTSIALVMALAAATSVFAGPVVTLGSAGTFGLLGGTISNTGVSNVVGNVGAVTTITGFPPGLATGFTVYAAGDPLAVKAYNDFLAFDAAASFEPSSASYPDLTVDRTFLGNNVYTSPLTDVVSTAGITLTFDAGGDSTEVFIIRTTRDLTVNGPINFLLLNGALTSNIFWIVGRTATLDPTNVALTWDGSILATTSFTMSANVGGSGVPAGTINGCVFSDTATTLAGQTLVSGGCGSSNASLPPTPEPGTAGLVGLGGLLCLLGMRRLSRARQ
jgi:hypothetical protein